MSSHKMRLRVRMHRLSDIAHCLGKDANAKEYELITLMQSFDRITRLQIVKLKNLKREKLKDRMGVMTRHGVKSRELRTLDEEINGDLKRFEADMTRLNGIYRAYEEKKEPPMDAREKGQRNNVLKALNDAKSIFKQEYEE